MNFKILVVFLFILHIYLHLCKTTNLYRLLTIIFYWSKVTFMTYLKRLIVIYIILIDLNTYRLILIYIWHLYPYILTYITYPRIIDDNKPIKSFQERPKHKVNIFMLFIEIWSDLFFSLNNYITSWNIQRGI